MSIYAIRNQPFQFGNNLYPRSLALMCCADDPVPSLIATTDEVWAQALVENCSDNTELIFKGDYVEGWDDFVVEGGWMPYSSVYRCLQNNPGSVISHPFTPTPGGVYRIEITAIVKYDGLTVTFGGDTLVLPPSVNSFGDTYTFDVAAGTADPFTITTGTGFYILNSAQLTISNYDVSAIFHQGSTELVFDRDDYPNNFYFFNGGFTFHMPMSTVGIAEGCFTLELRDNCSDTGMTSQVFRIVDANCETFLIRACNDYDNIGFVVPFVPRIRIPASMGWPSYNTDVQEERHSDGEIFRPYGDRTRTMTVKTGILNEFDHAFLSTLPLYDHVYIGSGDQAQEVVVNKGKYEPLYGEGQNLNGAVVFDVTPKAELVRKVQCGPALDGCAPESDPQCIGGPQYAWAFVPVDGGFDFQLTIISASNFTPSTASVTVADGAPVTQTVGTLPSTLTWGPFAAETPLTLRIFDAMNQNCVMTKFFDVPPTVCGAPDLGFNFIDNGDGSFDLEITMNTTEGFTPGDIYVEQGGVTTGEQTFGALPDTLTFVNLNNSQAVTVHIVNLVEWCTPYVEDIGVPFACSGDGRVGFSSDGTAVVNIFTTSGYYALTNLNTLDITEYSSGTPTPALAAGRYCGYSSTEGVIFGNIGSISFAGGASLIVVNNGTVVAFRSDLSASTTYDFSGNSSVTEVNIDDSVSGTLDLSTLPLTSATIKNNTTLTTVLLNPGISIGDPMNIDSDLSNNAFDVATVDAFCNGLDPLAAGGVTDISGGTNAAPTAASLSARNAYITAGNTLITN